MPFGNAMGRSSGLCARAEMSCLERGGWEIELQASSRDDGFLARCRFDTPLEALRFLKKERAEEKSGAKR